MKLLAAPRFWIIVILLLAAALRFYKLSDYLQFLGDEGRDVLTVERMIVDHQWTLLGPNASVGGFYTGPVYYYFMLPFLWLFNLSPVGPAVMAVLFGLGTILLTYVFCRRFISLRVALVAAFLVTVSPAMVNISRFSWNPNPVPFFALLAVYLLLSSFTGRWGLLTSVCGICLGILFQLHYMDLVMVTVVAVMVVATYPKSRILPALFFLGAGFLIGDSLFLLFEIRHGFPNTRSVLEFVTRKGGAVQPRSWNILWLFNDLTRRVFETALGFTGLILNLFYLGSLLGVGVWAVRTWPINKKLIKILGLWLVLGVLGVGGYSGQLLNHYFGFLYPLPFLFLAITAGEIWNLRIGKFIAILLLSLLTGLEIKNMYFWQPPNNLLTQTQAVDRLVLRLAGNQPYNFALGSLGNSDHAYRYFLEIWDRAPIVLENPAGDPGRTTITGQLIVVCESPCSPLGNPLWEIAGFGRGEITAVLTGPAGIKIYRLEHYRGI